jgi:hypothetical protein
MTSYLDLARAVPARPRVAPLDEWDSEAASTLIAVTLRRVSSAWAALDSEQQQGQLAGVQTALLDDLAKLEAARQARDMAALRLELGRWEATAEPIFQAYRAVRDARMAAPTIGS